MNLLATHRQLLDRLYPVEDAEGLKNDSVEYHWLGLLLTLAVRSDLLAATFPHGGPPDLTALKAAAADIGLDVSRLSDSKILGLAAEREAFAGLQRAWLKLASYENPPCPDNARLAQVVVATRAL